ncbi:LADA_0F14070g1_1 [Lachancea dasiensis]|uniref:LADA_0F14070g1_1 n=1 Tax=Lachancea dasiensis TaxID=1072105 RepID=A0A1G4JNF5_9SACH|nr:LADA_0F14070g1_1 [Lachancea dasiensis]
MSGTGRLQGLGQGSGKPSLKFKPKALARRSKEEREKAIPKPSSEELNNGQNSRKKYSKKDFGKQQKRVPKYLLNTRVVGAGFGAENFSGGGADARTGFIKSEGSPMGMDLLQRGLQQVNSGGKGAVEDGDSEEEGTTTRINMGREYRANELYASEEEENPQEDDELDEETLRSKRLAHFFPVRAVRVRHEDIDDMQKELKETMSETSTRGPTPGVAPVKSEHQVEDDDKLLSPEMGLQQGQGTELHNKLHNLHLESANESPESHEESKRLQQDHAHLHKKLLRINNQPGKFMFFQLPAALPDFEVPEAPRDAMEVEPETLEEPAEPADSADKTEAKKSEEKSKSSENVTSSNPPKQNGSKKADTTEPTKLLTGNIGSLRVHKSGKLSVKIGNVVMNINRGAENTFLQEVIALDEREDERTVELLGQIAGKAVVTPMF